MTPRAADSAFQIHATTVVGVRHGGRVALGSDGQATMGNTVLKHKAQKVRSLHGGKILAGFAGATADAFTLFERFEEKLQAYGGNVTRAAVELAKDWRTDRFLRRLEALLAVAASDRLLLISGTGDVIEPDDPILAIGSGGPYALAAARAMLQHGPDDAHRPADRGRQPPHRRRRVHLHKSSSHYHGDRRRLTPHRPASDLLLFHPFHHSYASPTACGQCPAAP